MPPLWVDQGTAGRDTLREATELCTWLYERQDPARPHLRWRGRVLKDWRGRYQVLHQVCNITGASIYKAQ